MAIAAHCDYYDCNIWEVVNAFAGQNWVIVTIGTGETRHYCSQWHAVMDLSKDAEVPTEIPNDLGDL